MRKEIVLIKESGVIGIVLCKHVNGNLHVMWYDDHIQFTMTLEEDEYILWEDMED